MLRILQEVMKNLHKSCNLDQRHPSTSHFLNMLYTGLKRDQINCFFIFIFGVIFFFYGFEAFPKCHSIIHNENCKHLVDF